MRVYVNQLPSGSAFMRSVHGDDVEWGLAEQLLALVADAAQIANWQRSADGAKGRRPPKPIPRPGVKEDADRKTIGTPKSIEELEAILASVRDDAEVSEHGD